MKKTWMTWIVLLCCLVLLAGCSNAGAEESRTKEPTVTDTYTVEEIQDVNTMYYQNDGGEKIALTYHKSLETDGGTLRYYLDGQSNQYAYDAAGELISYIPDTAGSTTQGKALSAKEIETLAAKYVGQIYGKAYLSKLTLTETKYSESLQNYDVYFDVVYDGRFITESCIATLRADGMLMDLGTFGKGRMDDFDPKLLEGIDQAKLDQIAADWIAEKYKDTKVSYQADEQISVIRTDGGFALSIPLDITVGEGEDEYMEAGAAIYNLQ